MIVIAAPGTVAAQTQTSAVFAKEAASKTWTPPRTPDGAPDIQGYFTNSTVTPLVFHRALRTTGVPSVPVWMLAAIPPPEQLAD